VSLPHEFWFALCPVLPRVRLGLTMGCKFCTIKFKDQVGLGSDFISSHF
jgi:hypothetical protein